MRAALVIGALAACGRAHFDELADAGQAGPLTYREAVLADAPVAYYRLSDTSGSTAQDDMQHVPGTYTTTCLPDRPGLLVGDADGALQLDGQCAVDLGDTLSFTDRQPFTLEAWIRHQPGGTGFQHIFARETRNVNPVDGYSMLVSVQTGVYAERAVATENFVTDRIAQTDGTTLYVVTVYTGDQLLLYIDGVLMGMHADTRALGTFATRSAIGAVTDPNFNSFFVGTIDEVAIYDKVLPEGRIQLHHQIGANGPIGP